MLGSAKTKTLSNEEKCENDLKNYLKNINFDERQTIANAWISKIFNDNMIEANQANMCSFLKALASLVGLPFPREYYRIKRHMIYFVEKNLVPINHALSSHPLKIKIGNGQEEKEFIVPPPPLGFF